MACNPLVTRECRASFGIAVKIEAADLDRSQVFNVERVVVFFDVVMRQRHLSPNPALQQAVIVAIELFADRNALRIEVLQRCPVALFLLDITNVNLVDKAVLALRRHLGLRGIGLVRANVVVLQRWRAPPPCPRPFLLDRHWHKIVASRNSSTKVGTLVPFLIRCSKSLRRTLPSKVEFSFWSSSSIVLYSV
jgi:hypothetical protein